MRYELFSSLNFGQVTDGQTDRQTQIDAYEPTVHRHRCAQKVDNPSIDQLGKASLRKGWLCCPDTCTIIHVSASRGEH